MQSFFLIISLFYIIGCSPKEVNSANIQTASPSITESIAVQGPDITIAKAKQMMETSKDIILIDVRTQGEVDNGIIGNPLHIDISKPDFKQKIEALDKSKEYIVYCAVGGRSGTAVKYMRQAGFDKSYNMMGGYKEWSRK